MRPLRAQPGRVPPRLSLLPASPVTRPGPGLAPAGLSRSPLPPAASRAPEARAMIVAVGSGGTGCRCRAGRSSGAGGVVSRPGLFGRLGGPARVTVVSAPPGSGKTVLLRSWISEAGLAERAAWVPAGRDERDPQRFWLSVLGALRRTAPGSALVQAADGGAGPGRVGDRGAAADGPGAAGGAGLAGDRRRARAGPGGAAAAGAAGDAGAAGAAVRAGHPA